MLVVVIGVELELLVAVNEVVVVVDLILVLVVLVDVELVLLVLVKVELMLVVMMEVELVVGVVVDVLLVLVVLVDVELVLLVPRYHSHLFLNTCLAHPARKESLRTDFFARSVDSVWTPPPSQAMMFHGHLCRPLWCKATLVRRKGTVALCSCACPRRGSQNRPRRRGTTREAHGVRKRRLARRSQKDDSLKHRRAGAEQDIKTSRRLLRENRECVGPSGGLITEQVSTTNLPVESCANEREVWNTTEKSQRIKLPSSSNALSSV